MRVAVIDSPCSALLYCEAIIVGIMTNFVVCFNPIHLRWLTVQFTWCSRAVQSASACSPTGHACRLPLTPHMRVVHFFHGKVGRRSSLHPCFAFFGDLILKVHSVCVKKNDVSLPLCMKCILFRVFKKLVDYINTCSAFGPRMWLTIESDVVHLHTLWKCVFLAKWQKSNAVHFNIYCGSLALVSAVHSRS